MNILEVIPHLGDPRGTEPFEWQCWGPRAQYLDWGGEENHLASAVFDMDTGLVYCLELFTGTAALRYLATDWAEAYILECQSQEINPDWVTDTMPWTDCPNAETILAVLGTLKGDIEL